MLKLGEKLRDISDLSGADKIRYEMLVKLLRVKTVAAGINIKGTDLRLLTSFLFNFPDEIQRVFTKSNIRKGFTLCGLVDPETSKPCVRSMLETVRGGFDEGEFDHLMELFPQCLRETYKRSLSDEYMLKIGIKPDVDLKGNVVFRTATTDKAENRMRAKALSMQAQRDLRTSVDVERRAKEEGVRQQRAMWYSTKAKQNGEVLGLLQTAQPGTTLASAKVESFSKLKADWLKAFCCVRTWLTKDGIPKAFKWPNKGTMNDIEAGTHTLVALAFSLRAKPIILAAPPAVLAPAPPVVATALAASAVISLAPEPPVAASSLISASNNALVMQLFHGCKVQQTPTSADVDLLCNLLQQRLNTFVLTKIPEGKQTSWVWGLMRRVLPYLAYVAAVFGHVIPDLAGASIQSCLLYPVASDRFVVVPEPAPTTTGTAPARSSGRGAPRTSAGINYTQGAYLFVHELNRRWLRAGKVGGRDIPERTKEHRAAAALTVAANKTSKFYGRYPTRAAFEADPTITTMRAGYFDDLTCVYALGFSRDDAAGVASFLNLTANEKTHIAALSFKEDGYSEKTAHIVAYAIEFCYSLMLSPSDDLSSNPGFEVPLNIYSTSF